MTTADTNRRETAGASSRRFDSSGKFLKCEECGETLFVKELRDQYMVCSHCGYHFRINSEDRIRYIADPDTFRPMFRNLESCDPLDFAGRRKYSVRYEESRQQTGLNDAAVCGPCKIRGLDAMLCVTDSFFMMGSMGSVVGETLARATEYATDQRLPLIIVSGSGGGARMDEGVFSLMQMAKTSAALARHDDAGLLFISVLTNPTFGGVSASFAMLGDFIIAEPKALIGFTGPRVIKQTINVDLPEGFQESEYLRDHGQVDFIVPRSQLTDAIAKLIRYTNRSKAE